MKLKVILKILSIVAALGLAIWASFALYNTFAYTPTKELLVNSVEVSDNTIIVDGETSSSADGYVGYNYHVNGDEVYIRAEYALAGNRNPSGHCHISIAGDFKSIRKVYLQGTPSDLRIIWENGSPVK